jgi:next to BRCA1 gene 1 protein
LIKFKTPVRNVSVTTMGEDRNGVAMATMGDQFQKSVSTETLPVSSANAATQVQTVADLKPTEAAAARPAKQLNIKDLLSEPVKEKITVQDLLVDPLPAESKTQEPSASASDAGSSKEISSADLNAHFIRDAVTDGTKMPSGSVFVQSWTVRNPGPLAWPAGCSVRYVGGDNMLNIDDTHPSSATEISEATETNTVTRQVEVGEEISFTVTLKAPKKEGTAISYWRLKAADGTPFGHRLWCHIEVTAPSHVAAQPDPEYNMKLMLLQRFNNARVEAARREQECASREATSKAALAEAEKRHAKVRAETLENMRRAAALLDGDFQKLTSNVANIDLGTSSSNQTVEPKVKSPSVSGTEAPAEESKLKRPTQPSVESAPPSPAHSSTMIFPKLEKESPVSSTHEAHRADSTASEAAASKANTETLMSPSVKSADNDIFEDAESVEFFDESDSDEDGFVTDEEYDILDASDEEAA